MLNIGYPCTFQHLIPSWVGSLLQSRRTYVLLDSYEESSPLYILHYALSKHFAVVTMTLTPRIGVRELLDNIVDQLNADDVSNVALSSHWFRPSVLRHRFNTITVLLPGDSHDFCRVKQFIQDHGAGRYVQDLTLTSRTFPVARCTVNDVLQVRSRSFVSYQFRSPSSQFIRFTPNLRVLDIEFARWYATTNVPFGSPTSLVSLRALHLTSIDVHSSSPLEIFDYIGSCSVATITSCHIHHFLHSWPQSSLLRKGTTRRQSYRST